MAQAWSFPPFRLELATGSLWRDDTLVPLPPKPSTVLATLVAHAGQVVPKEVLWDAAWPDTAVTEGVLKGCIGQIRRALGEHAGRASCIATTHRRGYRLCLPVTPIEALLPGAGPAERVAASAAPAPVVAAPPLVGREAELAQVQHRWDEACQGRRQVVFLTGEAGIGKTTLVEAFLVQLATMESVWSARGHCIEHYGEGKPYLPLLEALGHLGRGHDGAQLVTLLHQVAPTWLAHLPALVPPGVDEAVYRRAGVHAACGGDPPADDAPRGQALHVRRRRIAPGNSSGQRCPIVEDRSRLGTPDLRALGMARCWHEGGP